MIYFASIDGGPIKIGYSFNVETRMEQLSAHYGRPVSILATMPGGRAEERALHQRFAHLRLGRSEQFQPARELMSFIDRPLFVSSGDVELIEPAVPVIRVSDGFAEAIGRAASFEKISVAEFATRHLLPVVEKRYRDAVLKEAKVIYCAQATDGRIVT